VSEPDVSNLMSVADAIAIIDATPVTPREIRVNLAEAQGMRLAQDIIADRDSPPFDKSQMDGFAVRAADVPTAGEVELRRVGEIAAGNVAGAALRAGETFAIMTGAPLPAGADAVIPVEMSRKSAGDGGVILRGPATAGRFIAPRGSDCRTGEVLLRSGTTLESAQLAVAASVGAAEVQVFARPRVGVLATGNELVPVEQAPGPGQIRNSNSVMLVALLGRLGCDVIDLGIAPDSPRQIRDAISNGMSACDVLFISGGMSMGEHDYVPRVLSDLGVEMKITKLRIKPGKPFVFGVAPRGKFVFGLPGNPVSGFACTLRLCSGLLARIAGGAPQERWSHARRREPLGSNGPREFYQPAVVQPDGIVRPLPWKSSADIYTLAAANALLVRNENEPAQPAGALVRTLEIPT
jgi:molybdopterin molybdotransferase